MGRPLKVDLARPRRGHSDQRREDLRRKPKLPSKRTQRSSPKTGESKTATHFHNPYTFVPTPPREKAIKQGGFAGDFNPLEHPRGQAHNLDHASLKDDLWTGHIPITLKTVTPLVLLKTEGESRPQDKPYDVLDYIPESSLRGMLRSAYEVVTNSRYGCFSNENRLAYRMVPREALKLVPAVIEDGGDGKLTARLYAGTSTPTPEGPGDGTGERGPMYAAMLTCYCTDPISMNSMCDTDYTPKTQDEVWAEIVLCEHDESPKDSLNWNSKRQPHRNYLFWKVVKVWPKTKKGPACW